MVYKYSIIIMLFKTKMSIFLYVNLPRCSKMANLLCSEKKQLHQQIPCYWITYILFYCFNIFSRKITKYILNITRIYWKWSSLSIQLILYFLSISTGFFKYVISNSSNSLTFTIIFMVKQSLVVTYSKEITFVKKSCCRLKPFILISVPAAVSKDISIFLY